MQQQIYSGDIDPVILARHLLDTWDQGETAAQAMESDEGIMVQVGKRSGGFFNDTPRSAVTVAIEQVPEGLRVSVGEQQWYSDGGGQIMVGGLIGFFPFFFTWPLGGGRNEPVAPNLTAEVWRSIDAYVTRHGGPSGVSIPRQNQPVTGETTRLSSVGCPSCGTANPPEAERCRECGAFLQFKDCPRCGVSNPATANFCIRCGHGFHESRSVGG